MMHLSSEQGALVDSVTRRLTAIQGVSAVVLGGSYARGRAQRGSDIDLGLFYSEADPFSIDAMRELGRELNDGDNPVVSGFNEWGPWVNGGAWLTIGGQRLDFIYRSIERVRAVIADAEAGGYELDYIQQAPFGFFSGTYLGEIQVCVPLYDSHGLVAELKRQVARYPEAMRTALFNDYLWSAEFNLAMFAHKFAARGDVYGTVSCLTRAVNQMVLVLFAVNRVHPLNDKTVLAEISEFDRAPHEFRQRVEEVFASPGEDAEKLGVSVDRVTQLLHEVMALTDGAYQARYV